MDPEKITLTSKGQTLKKKREELLNYGKSCYSDKNGKEENKFLYTHTTEGIYSGKLQGIQKLKKGLYNVNYELTVRTV